MRVGNIEIEPPTSYDDLSITYDFFLISDSSQPKSIISFEDEITPQIRSWYRLRSCIDPVMKPWVTRRVQCEQDLRAEVWMLKTGMALIGRHLVRSANADQRRKDEREEGERRIRMRLAYGLGEGELSARSYKGRKVRSGNRQP